MRIGSIGVPITGIDVKVLDPKGREVSAGQPGELLIRAPATMRGYWKNPEASAEAFRDAWLRSGDTVCRNGDGFFWFMGRKKEIIVRGGSNIAPQEVEWVLDQHPAVIASCFVGLPDTVMGERGGAACGAAPRSRRLRPS